VMVDGAPVRVDRKYFDVVRVKEKVSGERMVPHVIEPSHGLDRIMYTCLEHAYTEKQDKEGNYIVMRLSPISAPVKVGVFPLMGKEELLTPAGELDWMLRMNGVITSFDDSGSIGRRYARMDEIGTPYCITVDYQTLEDGTVTIRERDSTEQVRVRKDEVVPTLTALLCGAKDFLSLKSD
jgi:glycyl-tRNA synthetase